MRDLGILERIFFVGTDGAPVVISDKNGFVGKLQQTIPYIFGFHCVAHRACLGVKDLAKEFPYISMMNSVVYATCSFFNTFNRLHILKMNQSELFDIGENECLNLIVPLDVRFISYEPAIRNLI